MYADDTTLSTTIDSTNENNCSTELINNELSKIHNWLLVKDTNPIRFAHQEDTQ